MISKSFGDDDVYGEFFKCSECDDFILYVQNERYCTYCSAPMFVRVENDTFQEVVRSYCEGYKKASIAELREDMSPDITRDWNNTSVTGDLSLNKQAFTLGYERGIEEAEWEKEKDNTTHQMIVDEKELLEDAIYHVNTRLKIAVYKK